MAGSRPSFVRIGVDEPSSHGDHIEAAFEHLRLRPPNIDDEEAVREAHNQLALECFEFALGHKPEMPWTAYLKSLEERRVGTNLIEGEVPATFLLADVCGEMVGRASIRHALNDRYLRGFGHIGYAVVPRRRGHGYANHILRASLVIARDLGIESALLVCGEQNLASIAVIEGGGGEFESCQTLDGTTVRRYWIDTRCP
jgi:predicted acetyltransferase